MQVSAFTRKRLQELQDDRNFLLWQAVGRRLCRRALANLDAGKDDAAVRNDLANAIVAAEIPLLRAFLKETNMLYLALFEARTHPASRSFTRSLLWRVCAEAIFAQTQLQPSAPKGSRAHRQQEYKLVLHELGMLVEDMYWQFAAMRRFWDDPTQSLIDMLAYWRGFLGEYLSAFYELKSAEEQLLQELLDPQTQDRQFLELLRQHSDDFAGRAGLWYMFPRTNRYAPPPNALS